MLLNLPDIIVWRICDFLPCEDIIRLSDADWRISKHLESKHRAAAVIQKHWKRMITRGRAYGSDEKIKAIAGTVSVASELRCMINLCLMPPIKFPLKYHTVLPRRRIVIPKCQFDLEYAMKVSHTSQLLCEFTTIPPVPLYIISNGARYQVTNESVIPLFALYVPTITFEKPSASYICYTEVYFDNATLYDKYGNNDDRECLNTNAIAMRGFMVHSSYSRKYSHLIP